MEEELTCCVCNKLFNNPVLLPCYHSLCLNCALSIQQPVQNFPLPQEDSGNDDCSDYLDVDKLSLVSETDSGVVCCSRPNSYVSSPNSLLFPPLQSSTLQLTCKVCQKAVYFDDNGALNLPKNRALRNIVDKYRESKQLAISCELCEGDVQDAVVMCEQCEIFYCEACKESCHPSRGPLAKHHLVDPVEGKSMIRLKTKSKEPKCVDHSDELLCMYCMLCKIPVCVCCMKEASHTSHDVQSLGAMCKVQKTELSQNLQLLSEEAKRTTEFIQHLKSMSEKISDNCSDLEKDIEDHCQCLVDAIYARKNELFDFIRKRKDCEVKLVKEQVTQHTGKLQQVTGLLQFCIEALKETDSTAFLQIGSSLIHRVLVCEMACHNEVSLSRWNSSDFRLNLDCEPVLQAVQNLTFSQMKTPGAPNIMKDDCTVENNTITISWQQHPTSLVDGFILEVDDGNSGDFKEVYCGKETICTLDGLHFNSVYNARVKAYNSIGDGDYSEIIALHTAEVAWFTLNPSTAHPDIMFSNGNQTVSCDHYEHRVVLGAIGFSRGVHYWEFTIDRYDGSADPTFGIARFDCMKNTMLGKDDKGWSMYIDHQRSWFLHADCHENRMEGGITVGSVVGVLLDLDLHQLSFFVNDEHQGEVAFSNLHGVFYPAVSLNRHVRVTVQTSLDPPLQKQA